jgi:hypothetical protein
MAESLNSRPDEFVDRRQEIVEEIVWAEDAHTWTDNECEKRDIERELDSLEQELAALDEPDA